MKDFADILRAWENQGGKAVPDAPESENVRPALPSRQTMERRPPDDEIDLHGLLKDDAVKLLRNFLSRSRSEGARKVLVIHGKGLHSGEGKAVLKEAVRQVVTKNPNVAAWGEAVRKDGGPGATWVWLNS